MSELRTEGSFGGIVDLFKYLFFLVSAIPIILFVTIRQGKRIKKQKDTKEAKIILSVLFVSTIIAISSFWFSYDYFDKEPEFIALAPFGTELTLTENKFRLKIRDYEWTTIERGLFEITKDTLVLDGTVKEKRWKKSTNKYLIVNKSLIPIYSDGMETDSTEYLQIVRNKTNGNNGYN